MSDTTEAKLVAVAEDGAIHDTDVWWLDHINEFEAADDFYARRYVEMAYGTAEGPAVLLLTNTKAGPGNYRALVFEQRGSLADVAAAEHEAAAPAPAPAGSWSCGPYGPGCAEPMWRCNRCDEWCDNNDLPACPACGFDGAGA